MFISFDAAKSERNEQERGLPFSAAEHFEWSSALIRLDDRKDYGEPRYQALGFIDDRLHALVFTPRLGRAHIISLRKANDREVARYGFKQKSET